MSNFWKGVQIGFLDDQSKQLAKRREDALEYKRQQQERARKSRKELQQRKTIANMAVTKASQLQRLGVTEQQIAAAAASGPEGIFTFADDVISYAKKNNIDKFTASQVQSLIDTPEMLKEDLGEDFDLKQFIRGNYGLVKPTLGSEAGKPRNILQRAFAIGERDAVRADLDKDAYYEGYSIFDLNELASMDAYGSLLPGSYATFTGVDYNPVDILGEFDSDLAQTLRNRQSDIDALDPGFDQARKKGEIVREVIGRFASRPYGDNFLEDIKERFPDHYEYFTVGEKTKEKLKNVINELEGDKQSIRMGGIDYNFSFTFDEKTGKPTSGNLNGDFVLDQAVLALFAMAQDAGLYPNHVILPDIPKPRKEEKDPPPDLSITGQALDPENITKEDVETKTDAVVEKEKEEELVDPTEIFEVKQVTNEEGITNYVVVNKDTGEKVKGSPDFRFFDTAKAAILANEFPYVIREEEGSPAPDAEQSKEVRKEQPVRSDIETILSSFIEQGGASYDNVQSMIDAWEKWSVENEVEDSIKQKVLRTLKSMYPSDQ